MVTNDYVGPRGAAPLPSRAVARTRGASASWRSRRRGTEEVAINTLQVWLLVGVPALLLGSALFVGRSGWRTALGYGVLAVGFVVVAAVERTSAALFACLLALLVAAGRGGALEQRTPAEADVPGWIGSDRTLDPPKRG